MGIQAQAAASANPFERAEAKFFEVVGGLVAPERQAMSHAEAEEHILEEGREMMRLLLQGYLDRRSEAEPRVAVVGADGVSRTHCRPRGVPLLSVVGEVRVERSTYSIPGVRSLAPLDGALNLPSEVYSFGLQKRVAEEVARGSYGEATKAVIRQTGVAVPNRQAEEVAIAAAQDFDEFYAARGAPEQKDVLSGDAPSAENRAGAPAGQPEQEDDEAGDILSLSTDGKGIVMRAQALREATRKAAAEAEHKLGKRLSRGEKKNRKRMALVAAVYAIAPFVRKPEDIIRELRQVEDVAEVQQRPKPQDKRVWASVQKDMDVVIDETFQEALRRDPERKKRWVVLIDGNKDQLKAMLAAAARYGVTVTIILDIIHVIEYLWKAAWVFYDEGDKEAEKWVTQKTFEVLRGRAVYVAAAIRRMATNRKLRKTTRQAADKCASYLLKYKDYLHYDQYLAAGLPIATGVIEGACRYLIKDRMDITGARWGVDGAEAVLRLRALRSSGDFDEYWAFHQRQELQRNHLSRYAGAKLPETPFPAPNTPFGRHLRVVR